MKRAEHYIDGYIRKVTSGKVPLHLVAFVKSAQEDAFREGAKQMQEAAAKKLRDIGGNYTDAADEVAEVDIELLWIIEQQR